MAGRSGARRAPARGDSLRYRQRAFIVDDIDIPREFTELERALCSTTLSVQTIALDISERLLGMHRVEPGSGPLRLSLGGYSLAIRPQTVMKLPGRTKLHRFVMANHEQRLHLCDAFMQDSAEYYFERSALTFNPIFQYFITGSLHRPERLCPIDFLQELNYWDIPITKVADCCRHELIEKIRMIKKVNEVFMDSDEEEMERFKKMRCGEVRKLVWSLWLLMEHPESSFAAKIMAVVSMAFVFTSVSALILASVEDFAALIRAEQQIFDFVENACIIWFTFEYVMKLVVSPRPCRVCLQFASLVDLIAIAPFYLELALEKFGQGVDGMNNMNQFKSMFLVIRVLRVVRVMRIFKLGQYSRGLKVFALSMRYSLPNLVVFSIVLFTSCAFFSFVSYFIDEGRFKSIPDAFWWSFVTMTTVGYGDIVPETIWGKLFASGCIMSGALVLAIPIPFIIDNWAKAMLAIAIREQRQRNRRLKQKKKEDAAAAAAAVAASRLRHSETMETNIPDP